MAVAKPIPSNKLFQDLSGRRFGRWEVVSYAGKMGPYPSWNCRCECGNERVIRGFCLKDGSSQSCGCLHKERAGEQVAQRSFKHGFARRGAVTPEYKVWANLITRCTNENRADWKNYAGRGIALCERWRNSFQDFLADVGPRPSARHTLERIDNDGGYEPGNVKWATRTEQNRNTRQNRLLTWNGRTRCAVEWAEVLGMNYGTLRDRLYRGWTVEETLSTPMGKLPERLRRRPDE